MLAIQFADLLEALAATPAILAHQPSAVEVMDALHPRSHEAERGAPPAAADVRRGRSRRAAVRRVLRRSRRGSAAAARRARAGSGGAPIRVSLSIARSTRRRRGDLVVREAALGLSMAMKGDAKSLSFVEDTAVAPERLRDYISVSWRSFASTAPRPACTRTRPSAACTCGRSSI